MYGTQSKNITWMAGQSGSTRYFPLDICVKSKYYSTLLMYTLGVHSQVTVARDNAQYEHLGAEPSY